MSASSNWSHGKNSHVLFFVRIKWGKIFKTFRIVPAMHKPPLLRRYLLLLVWLGWLPCHLERGDGSCSCREGSKIGQGCKYGGSETSTGRKDPRGWSEVRVESLIISVHESICWQGQIIPWSSNDVSLSLHLPVLLFVMLYILRQAVSMWPQKYRSVWPPAYSRCFKRIRHFFHHCSRKSPVDNSFHN